MTVGTDYLEDEELILGNSQVIPVNPLDQAYVGLNNLPAEVSGPIRRVMEAGTTVVQRPPRLPLDLLEGRISEAPVVQEQVARVANEAGIAGQPIRDSILSPQRVRSPLADELAHHSREEIDEANDFLADMKGELEQLQPHSLPDEVMKEVMDMDHEEIVANAAIGRDFPDLARLIMNLGMNMEARTTKEKILRYKQEADACKAKIDKLLKLSAELPRMNTDDGSYELKEEAKAKILELAKELKEVGIDIFPGSEVGGEITKDQLAAANSLINHHIDQNKTILQELFTTKISVTIQFLQMMNEVMKKISELDDRQKKKAIEEARR